MNRRPWPLPTASPTRLTTWLTLVAASIAAGWPASQAQVPTTTAEELKRQWDLNRDGTIDAAEAEIARGRMRRARSEGLKKDTAPVTGRPRSGGEAAAGPAASARPQTAAIGGVPRESVPEDDGGLILVPGTGEPPPASAGAAALPPAAAPPRRQRDALPGTRAPSTSSTIPSTASTIPSTVPPSTTPPAARGGGGLGSSTPDGRGAAGGQLSSRARVLPNGVAVPSAPPQPGAPRPGVISGGARPAAPSQGLNAGRLPGGPPQPRGYAPGAAGSAMPAAPRPPIQQFGAGAAAAARGVQPRGGYPPAAAPPVSGPGGTRFGPQSLPPSMRQAPAARSAVRPPGMQPPTLRPPQTSVPRPGRVGPEDFYGR